MSMTRDMSKRTDRIRPVLLLYILFVWFVISLVTNIIGPLMPVMVEDFHLSLTLAGFLPFAFFLAYGLVSIPAGAVVETRGPRFAMLVALVVNLCGATLFALVPRYAAAIASLFILGIGMAMLQVVINPLMRVAGGERNFSFFAVLAQLVFGLASYAGAAAFLMVSQSGVRLPVAGPAWIGLYWLFAALFVVTLLATAVQRFPAVELKDDERPGPVSLYLKLLCQRKVILFFLGIAAYVGTEQMLANWMSQFLSVYHGISPTGAGAETVGRFWAMMALGCLVGLLLLKLMDARIVLVAACVAAMATVLAALLGSAPVALVAFPFTGFCLSVMFSIIFSLALNSVPDGHGAFSGILCSGIVGGAIFPLLAGFLGEHFGLRAAMFLTLGTLAYILSIGIWARPIVHNQTIDLKALRDRLRGGRQAS